LTALAAVYLAGVALSLGVLFLLQVEKAREDGAPAPAWFWPVLAAIAIAWPVWLVAGVVLVGIARVVDP